MIVVVLAGAGVRAHAVPAPTPTPAGISSADGSIPSSVRATVRRGSLAVTLSVAPVNIGPARFVADVRDHGRALLDAQVGIRLSMPAWSTFGAPALATTPCSGGYCATGTLQALGRWRAVVLVREQGSPLVAAVPFDLMNGANARFLFAQPADTRFGPASVTLAQTARGPSSLRVLLRPGLQVRALLSMPNMLSMGTATYRAMSLSGGWYGLSFQFAMTGVNQILLQARTPGGWATARTLLYDVDGAGRGSLLTNTAS
jgi:hypothetical protein